VNVVNVLWGGIHVCTYVYISSIYNVCTYGVHKYQKMVTQEQTIVDSHNVSMTLKINAKGEIYGEFTCKAPNTQELAKLVDECKQLYVMHTSRI